MYCVPVGASRRLRWGCLSLAAIVAMLAVTSDPADARRRHKRSHARLASISSSYNPPYAAIVVDANNGAVLHAAAPDAPRHPASLTKIMTLYLLFERLESGKIALDTPMAVSEEASSQAPTKLGLRPGDTLKVEDAIKGLVTKSANDAAVVIAEALGGSEDEFARDHDAQGPRARHAQHHLPQSPTACRTTSRSPPRATRRCSASRSRSASRSTTGIFRWRASSIAATPCATTTICSARSRASTASRPATPAIPASIS